MVGEWVSLDQCRLLPRCPGIYAIRDAEGREYIGKSSNVRARLGDHRRSKGDTTSWIGRAIAKRGAEAFECCLLVRGVPSVLSGVEVLLIAQRGSRAPAGYNLTDGGDGSPGHKLSEDHKRRISLANTGREKTVEGRQRIGEAHRGMKHSQETRQLISEAGKGRKMSESNWARLQASLTPAVIEKRSALLRGRTRSDEVRSRMAESARARNLRTGHAVELGRRNRKPVVGWPPDEVVAVVFSSGQAAAAVLGVAPTSISDYCRGVRHSGGWTFGYL